MTMNLHFLTPAFPDRDLGRPEPDGLVEVDEGCDGDAGVDAGVARGHVAHRQRVAAHAARAVLHAVLGHARVGADRGQIEVLKIKQV